VKRIVFIAIVGRIGVPTNDGRVLEDQDVLDHRPYPLPVFGRWEGNGFHRPQIGVIESAAVVDRRLIVFGRMFTGIEAAPYVERLALGQAWLEIDLSYGSWETGPGQPYRFTQWSLTAAAVGDHPCWDLPPVQIEELTNA
jgi:hypothetical protein